MWRASESPVTRGSHFVDTGKITSRSSYPEKSEDQTAELSHQFDIDVRQWWHTPLIPAVGQRQKDLCEFKTTLNYMRLNLP